jgi:SET domain-containing protein
LVALRDIEMDEELFYDYGERRKDIIEAFPWLNE